MGERPLQGFNRRQFLGTTGGVLATVAASSMSAAAIGRSSTNRASHGADETPHKRKKIPIGVFDPVYKDVPLDQMLEKVSALGLEAMEIGTGGYPNSYHCPVADLLADPAKAKAWKKRASPSGSKRQCLLEHLRWPRA